MALFPENAAQQFTGFVVGECELNQLPRIARSDSDIRFTGPWFCLLVAKLPSLRAHSSGAFTVQFRKPL
ncbi:MAG TPA: hypothetical protein DCS89_13345 [Gammaproteobacteria bacterium]|nr:hypothetical protein [Gammaproteobacteria bacterium]